MMDDRKLIMTDKGTYHMKIQLEEKYTDPVTEAATSAGLKKKYQENCLHRMNHYAVMTINIKKIQRVSSAAWKGRLRRDIEGIYDDR